MKHPSIRVLGICEECNHYLGIGPNPDWGDCSKRVTMPRQQIGRVVRSFTCGLFETQDERLVKLISLGEAAYE